MIKLLLEPVNLLILDEPTNHLDLKSKDVLKEAIREFDGTVIIVSHDRDFLDGLVERVYEFGGGKVREHLGGIYDWIRSRPTPTLPAREGDSGARLSTTLPRREGRGGSAAASYEEQKAQARAQKKREKELADAEAQVAQLESAIAILEEQMATEAGSQDMSLYEKHTKLKQQLTQAEERWMELMETEM